MENKKWMIRANNTLADTQQPIQCLEIKFFMFFITYNLSFCYILFFIIKRPFITRSYHIAKFLYCTCHLIEKRTQKDIERHYRNLVVLQ